MRGSEIRLATWVGGVMIPGKTPTAVVGNPSGMPLLNCGKCCRRVFCYWPPRGKKLARSDMVRAWTITWKFSWTAAVACFVVALLAGSAMADDKAPEDVLK